MVIIKINRCTFKIDDGLRGDKVKVSTKDGGGFDAEAWLYTAVEYEKKGTGNLLYASDSCKLRNDGQKLSCVLMLPNDDNWVIEVLRGNDGVEYEAEPLH